MLTWSEGRVDERIELAQHFLGDRLERLAAVGEREARRTAVVGIAAAAHKAIALTECDELGRVLLRQARPERELPDSQPIVLEQRQQNGPVRGAHLGKPGGGEALGQQLVPVLGGLRQLEPEVCRVRSRHTSKNSTPRRLILSSRVQRLAIGVAVADRPRDSFQRAARVFGAFPLATRTGLCSATPDLPAR
jgi:hypothetical protein